MFYTIYGNWIFKVRQRMMVNSINLQDVLFTFCWYHGYTALKKRGKNIFTSYYCLLTFYIHASVMLFHARHHKVSFFLSFSFARFNIQSIPKNRQQSTKGTVVSTIYVQFPGHHFSLTIKSRKEIVSLKPIRLTLKLKRKHTHSHCA